MSRPRRLAWAGALAGAVVAGTAAGLAAEKKRVRAARLHPDAQAGQPFGLLPAERGRIVVADDGVGLWVEEVGAADAELTIVFVHGYCLSMHCWHYQRQALQDLGRLVFFDQRSHGRSDASDVDRCTIDQLGHDLGRVVDECGGPGRVVLVGHSMGGMTIMALAEQRPELFGDRVAGVALLATSSGRLAEAAFGLPAGLGLLLRRVEPHALVGLSKRVRFVERGRRRGSDLAFQVVRRLAFGSQVPPSLVDEVEGMIADMPLEAMAAFAPTFLEHDKLHALPALAGVPVLVVGAEKDLLCPAAHSEAIAAALPDAELVVSPGAGHMVIMERADLVNGRLRELCERARA